MNHRSISAALTFGAAAAGTAGFAGAGGAGVAPGPGFCAAGAGFASAGTLAGSGAFGLSCGPGAGPDTTSISAGDIRFWLLLRREHGNGHDRNRRVRQNALVNFHGAF